MNTCYDLAIVGSGFGGSLLALAARRLGLSVALIERGAHPRFAIGESTSPLMNLLLEQLAHRYDLPRLLPLTTYGQWQRSYPDLVCGLKRGFTYYHHEAGKRYQATIDRSNQLMVAASPHDAVADTHWLRADVDQFLMREAVALGAEYLDHATLASATFENGMGTLRGEHGGHTLDIRARLVVDASGPNGFLARALHLPTAPFADFPPTQTLYSHFTNVHRCETLPDFQTNFQQTNFQRELQTNGVPPYPPDDAALHHVFEGGWMWVLRFGNGVTSAGIAVEDWLAQELHLSEGEAAWTRFLNRFPSVAAQFTDARPTRPFTYAPRIAYRTTVAAGNGWLLLPSAAAFVDPLFSTGMPLTLLGIERLGRILEETWDTDVLNARLAEYGQITLDEADWTAHFIGTCYAGMKKFALFREFSMFYFAAASYSEMARRLEQPHLVRRFLAADHADFAQGLTQCAHRLRSEASRSSNLGNGEIEDQKFANNEVENGCFATQVAESIACLNIAGLCDPHKHNWYGVDMDDVIRGATKLQMTPEQIANIIAIAPWAQVPTTQ
jgi:FADH2 O2-dependent halogenase